MKSINKINLNNYNTIIFDCDGVILNSNNIKKNTFIETLNLKYDKKSIKAFIEYHNNNGGISRFNKFKFFFDKILKIKNYKRKYIECINSFSKILRKKLEKCEIDKSLIKLIENNNIKKFFVISAAEQKELREIFKKNKLDKYFYEIYGSPSNKSVNLKKILRNKKIKKPFLYLGDSKEDYLFSKKNNIDFIFVYHWTNLVNWKKFCLDNKIRYIKELKSLI